MSGEEMIRVGLDDDYYLGAYFATDSPHLDYEVPRSQLERWEAAKVAYEEMQGEIEQVMQEQRDRALALAMERRKSRHITVSPAVTAAYESAIAQMLRQGPFLNTLVPTEEGE